MVDNPSTPPRPRSPSWDDAPVRRGALNVTRLSTQRGSEAALRAYGGEDEYGRTQKTGRLLCWTTHRGHHLHARSATIMSEPVEFELLPFLVIEGGRKVAIQRGASPLCLTPWPAQAAVDF